MRLGRVLVGPLARVLARVLAKFLAILAALTGLIACGASQPQGPVDPADHTAFYLWTGVAPHPAMADAEAIYLLWGELRKTDPSRIVPLRREPPRADNPEVWLVVRAERLDWQESAFDQLVREAGRWQAAGRLTGIQVDFDSSTGSLGDYGAFLSRMRTRLRAGLRLSATGLMDWPANASDADLARLRATLDEIVIQTYQDRTTLPDAARYLASLDRLRMPHRVALVQGGAWPPPGGMKRAPGFKGYVVFLLADQRTGKTPR